jgi:guanine deaminase
MSNFILQGNICYRNAKEEWVIVDRGYLVCENQKKSGIYREIPESYKSYPMVDCGEELLLFGRTDTQISITRYNCRGLQTDHYLEEDKFADLRYAQRSYEILINELRTSDTTRVAILATFHRVSTNLCMQLLDESGLRGWVGMPIEEGENFKEETIRWILETKHTYPLVKPVLVSRLTLKSNIKWLSEISKLYQVPLWDSMRKEDELFDILVLSDKRFPHPRKLCTKERLDRLLYLADDRDIVHKYVAGKKLF